MSLCRKLLLKNENEHLPSIASAFSNTVLTATHNETLELTVRSHVDVGTFQHQDVVPVFTKHVDIERFGYDYGSAVYVDGNA